jgi:hypothetical protein
MAQKLADQRCVGRTQLPGEGLVEGGPLGAQRAAGQVRQDGGVDGPLNHRVQHRSARPPEDVRRDGRSLEPRVFQPFLHRLASRVRFRDQNRAVAGESTARSNRDWRHGAAPQLASAQLTAFACTLPRGSGKPLSRWSITELARAVVQRGIVRRISAGTIWRWLRADRIKLWQYHS